MLELTQQSLAFQQERSQLTDMLHAQHESMQQLVEETQTQEAALHGLSQHAQEADQQVRQIIGTILVQLMACANGLECLSLCASAVLTCSIVARYSTALEKHMHNSLVHMLQSCGGMPCKSLLCITVLLGRTCST